MSVRKFLLQQLRRYPIGIPVATVLTVLKGFLDGFGLAMFIPLLQLVISDDAMAANNRIFTTISDLFSVLRIPFTWGWVLILIFCLFLAKGLAQILYSLLMGRYQIYYVRDVRISLYREVFRASWPFFFKQKTGDLANTLTSESQGAGVAFQYLNALVASCVDTAIYFTIAFAASWQMTVFAGILAAVVIYAFKTLVTITKTWGSEAVSVRSQLQTEVMESISGVKLIKSAALEDMILQRFRPLANRLAALTYRMAMGQAILFASYEPLTIAMLGAGFYISLAYFKQPVSNLMVLGLLSYRIYQRVSVIQRSQQKLNIYLPCVEAVQRLHQEAGAYVDGKGGLEFKAFNSQIEVREVSFAYEEGDPILRDINLIIPKGLMIAIVGSSGIGKTTLLDFIIGLLTPSRGDILVDGVPLRKYRNGSWVSRIGYVPQETILFNDTIFNNIACVKPDAGEEDVIKAAQMAFAHDFILDLPNGYQTIVGERGTRLSGGQRQRIALARALVCDPEILILDEATSELDSQSEAIILRAIKQLRGSVTIITATHRLSMLEATDKIYALEGDRIVETTLAELKERAGIS